MSSRRFRFPELVAQTALAAPWAVIVLVACWPGVARGQACCAGGSVITPARLEAMENELVGVQAKMDGVVAQYTTSSKAIANARGQGEYDLEQDVFGAVRVLGRGQVAVLVPINETWRQTLSTGSAFGGGIGDVNLSARYDFLGANEHEWIPGIALLAGVTFPTGKPADEAAPPLAVDATGVGTYQLNAALALERAFGPWLVNATAMVAKRTERNQQTLGTQFTFLAALAYTFPNASALALSASYVFEGDATDAQGADVPNSSKGETTLALSGLWPIGGEWRIIGSTFANPPFDAFGTNETVDLGLTAGVIRSWM